MKNILLLLFAILTVGVANAQAFTSQKKLDKLEAKLAKRQAKKDAKAKALLSINKKIGAVADFTIGMEEDLFVIRNRQAYLHSANRLGNIYAIKQRNWKKKKPNYQFFYFTDGKLVEINTGVKPAERIEIKTDQNININNN